MAMRIVFITENDFSSEEQAALQQLFADAVGEFISAREPVWRYVEKRYEDAPMDFRERKTVEVTMRVSVAKKVRASLISFEIAPTETKL